VKVSMAGDTEPIMLMLLHVPRVQVSLMSRPEIADAAQQIKC